MFSFVLLFISLLTFKLYIAIIRDLVDVTARQPDGEIQNSLMALNSCPSDYDSLVADDILDEIPSDNDRPKTGASVIPAARLAKLGENIQGGSHTSDIAMLAMLDAATETIKFSQQDMLPLILSELLAGLGFFTGRGYSYTGQVTGTGFDDTWRIIGGIAKAITRRVHVHMLVSAPCAFAGDDPKTVNSIVQFNCPNNGDQGKGFDYWEKAYAGETNMGFLKWPEAREEDKEWGHIFDDNAFSLRKLTSEYINVQQIGNVHRELAYGYGWSLGNIAEWIFA